MVGRKKRAKCTPRSASGTPRFAHSGSGHAAAASFPSLAPAKGRGRGDAARGLEKVRARWCPRRSRSTRSIDRIARNRTGNGPLAGPVASTLWSLGHGRRILMVPAVRRGTRRRTVRHDDGPERRSPTPPARFGLGAPAAGTLVDRRSGPPLSRAERTPHATNGPYIRNWRPARTGNAHQVSSIWSPSSSPMSCSTSKSSEFRKIARVSAPRKSPIFSEAW